MDRLVNKNTNKVKYLSGTEYEQPGEYKGKNERAGPDSV